MIISIESGTERDNVEPDLEELTAYHEAGHAVMAVALGGRIIHVSIEPPDDDGLKRSGESIVQWPATEVNAIEEAEIKVSLAGPVTEMMYVSEVQVIASVPEFAADWQRASAGAARLKSTLAERIKLLSRAEIWLRSFFEKEDHWAAVGAVADELLAHETLEHEVLADIVSFWLERH